jgi:hypothetical protein
MVCFCAPVDEFCLFVIFIYIFFRYRHTTCRTLFIDWWSM